MLVEKYPDQRFGQIMRNYGVISQYKPPKEELVLPPLWQNDFYLESFDTLRRMESETKNAFNGMERAQLMAEMGKEEDE